MEKKSTAAGLKLNFWLLALASTVIIFSLAASFVFANRLRLDLASKTKAAEEAAKPAELRLTLIKANDCPDCSDLTPIVDKIKSANVKLLSETTIEASTEAGKKAIAEHALEKLPSLIVEGELEKNPDLKNLWLQLGNVKDGIFILTQVGAPYQIVSTGEIKGRVELLMLTDRTCKTCYDVTVHESVLPRYGIRVKEDKVMDINLPDGQALARQYQIKLEPTFILKGEVGAYPSLVSIWKNVGTVEKDGVYVFREGVKQMGVYKDLTSGRIIDPKQAASQTSQ